MDVFFVPREELGFIGICDTRWDVDGVGVTEGRILVEMGQRKKVVNSLGKANFLTS